MPAKRASLPCRHGDQLKAVANIAEKVTAIVHPE